MIIPQPVNGGGGGGRWANKPSTAAKTVHPCTLSVSGLGRVGVAPVAPSVSDKIVTVTTWEQMEITQQ